jgi:hypothetical protein
VLAKFVNSPDVALYRAACLESQLARRNRRIGKVLTYSSEGDTSIPIAWGAPDQYLERAVITDDADFTKGRNINKKDVDNMETTRTPSRG